MNTKLVGLLLLFTVGAFTLQISSQETLQSQLMNALNHEEGLGHQEFQKDPQDKEAFQRLIAFVKGDPQVLAAAQSSRKPSKAVVNKLVQWMLNDPVYFPYMVRGIAKSKDNEWMKPLNFDAQKRAVKIMVQAMLNDPKFNPLKKSSRPSKAIANKIIDGFLADAEIKPAFINSIQWDRLKNSARERQRLIKAAPQFKNFDFSNLTEAQKIEILRFFGFKN